MKGLVKPETALNILEAFGDGLGSRARIQLIVELCKGPATVEHLSEASGLSIANTSQHLQRLNTGGWVQVQREGRQRIYSLRSPEMSHLFEAFLELALNLSFQQLREQAISDLKSGQGLWVDTRDAAERARCPLPETISLDALKKKKLSKKTRLYLVCNGPFCQKVESFLDDPALRKYNPVLLRTSPVGLATALQAWDTHKALSEQEASHPPQAFSKPEP